MKRYIVMLTIILFFSYTLCADAREGTVEIISPVEDEIFFSYVKVADIENGKCFLTAEYEKCDVDLNEIETAKEMREALEVLKNYEVKAKNEIQTFEGKVIISDLEEGIYLIESASKGKLQISSTLVSIPAYNDELGEMSYDITVIPKAETVLESVKTGDEIESGYVVTCGIALIIIVVLACHRYLECVRIRKKKKRF